MAKKPAPRRAEGASSPSSVILRHPPSVILAEGQNPEAPQGAPNPSSVILAEGQNPEAQPGAPGKEALRRRLLSNRAATSNDERARRDAARLKLAWPLLTDAAPGVVAIYLSAPGEPGTLALAARLRDAGVRLLVPAPGPGDAPWRQPAWTWYDAAPVDGPFGVPVSPGEQLPSHALARADVVIVPGLAGSPAGDRLGRGGGWYDRALADAPTSPRWLLLNDDEVLAALPREPHDARVNRLVTPSRVIACDW